MDSCQGERESAIPLMAWPRRMPSSHPSLPQRPCCIRCRSVCLSSYHSQFLWNMFVTRACMCSQFTPLSMPMCSLLHATSSFSSCTRSTRTVVFQKENTQRSAIARNSRRPLSTLASGFLRNTRRRIFHASGARHSSSNRLSNQCVTSCTVCVG